MKLTRTCAYQVTTPVLLLLSLLCAYGNVRAQSCPTRFAVIGDYGSAGQAEADVSSLVKSWNPDFVITTRIASASLLLTRGWLPHKIVTGAFQYFPPRRKGNYEQTYQFGNSTPVNHGHCRTLSNSRSFKQKGDSG